MKNTCYLVFSRAFIGLNLVVTFYVNQSSFTTRWVGLGRFCCICESFETEYNKMLTVPMLFDLYQFVLILWHIFISKISYVCIMQIIIFIITILLLIMYGFDHWQTNSTALCRHHSSVCYIDRPHPCIISSQPKLQHFWPNILNHIMQYL